MTTSEEFFGGFKIEVDRASVEVFGSKKRSKVFKYWKMCERQGCPVHRNRKGWVTIGPTLGSDPYEHAMFISVKLMTELPDRYGMEPVGSSYMTTPKNSGITRYLPILQNGGLHEFPADQIVSLGWHKVPDVYNALTPSVRAEVDRLTSKEYACEYGCYENGQPKVFNDPDSLSRHIKVHHREAVQAVAVGNAIKGGLEKTAPVSQDSIADIVAAVIAAYDRIREQPRRGRQRSEDGEE